jgi:hypothetical protein
LNPMIKFKRLKSIYLYTLNKLIYKFSLDNTNDDDPFDARPNTPFVQNSNLIVDPRFWLTISIMYSN